VSDVHLRCLGLLCLLLCNCDGCGASHDVDAASDLDASTGDAGDAKAADAALDAAARDAEVDAAFDAAADSGGTGLLREVVRCGNAYCSDTRPWCCPFGSDFAWECFPEGPACLMMPADGEFEPVACGGESGNCEPALPFCCTAAADVDPSEGCSRVPLAGWTCVGPKD
jgi:hypothetical protein